MSQSLAELLRLSAEAVPEPRFDVPALVAEAGRRQRRRGLATVGAAVAVVGALAIGTLVARDGQPQELEPAPSPAPSPPGSVAVDPTGTRPLVYAEGRTVHVGDRTIRANEQVMLVSATDDGVVFMTDLDRRVWFDDGSGPIAIGESRSLHVGDYPVDTGNPGSLVVWSEGIGRHPDLVVYDTSQGAEVARFDEAGARVLVVGSDAVFLVPDWSVTPGCWLVDERPCADPHLLRYDVASGGTEEITRDAYEAELLANPRNFVIRAEVNEATRSPVFPLGARLHRHGERLVVSGEHRLTRTSGDPVALRWASARGDIVGFWAVQWLDDDRVVLAGYEEDEGGPSGIGQGDSYAASYVDLLVCTLPTGGCDEVVPLDPATPYVTSGRNTFQ